MSEETVLVCMRVADMAAAPVKSRGGRCGLCGKRVWVAESSPLADRIWCGPCAIDAVDGSEKVMELTDQQRADIALARDIARARGAT